MTAAFRLLALICLALFLNGCTVFVERPSCGVVEKSGPFELRDYGKVIVAETQVDATLEKD